jgi:hypothetical protein
MKFNHSNDWEGVEVVWGNIIYIIFMYSLCLWVVYVYPQKFLECYGIFYHSSGVKGWISCYSLQHFSTMSPGI